MLFYCWVFLKASTDIKLLKSGCYGENQPGVVCDWVWFDVSTAHQHNVDNKVMYCRSHKLHHRHIWYQLRHADNQALCSKKLGFGNKHLTPGTHRRRTHCEAAVLWRAAAWLFTSVAHFSVPVNKRFCPSALLQPHGEVIFK